MNDVTLWKIARLTWWKNYNGWAWYADTIFGPITIRINGRDRFEFSFEGCDTGEFLDDQAALGFAEKKYRERLAAGLVEATYADLDAEIDKRRTAGV
jgi:hypothetical protein